MKLSARTLIVPPLLDVDLLHVVQGGASWKATLAQIFEYLFSTKQALKITYTGTPQAPLYIPGGGSLVIVPVAAVAGQASYPGTLRVACGAVWYNEAMATTGNRLATLSFDDLQFAIRFDLSACTLLTSLALPELLQLSSGITLVSLPLLTTYNAPKLTDTGSGNFFVGVCNSLATITAALLVNIGLNCDFRSMAVLTSVSFPELVTIGGGLTFQFCPLLTTWSFPKLKYQGGSFNPNTGAGTCALLALSFPLLEVVGGGFGPTTMPLVVTWSFPNLINVGTAVRAGSVGGGDFVPTAFAALLTLNTPSLVLVNGNYSPNTMALLTTLQANVLASVLGNFAPTAMAALVTFSFPSLATIGGNFAPTTMAALTTATLAAMASYGGTIAIPSASMANVSSFTMGTVGTLKSIAGATITLSGLKLPSANVNSILALLVSLDGTGGTTLWGAGKTLTINGGTNGAPTGQGITDKATLIARGATVTTN